MFGDCPCCSLSGCRGAAPSSLGGQVLGQMNLVLRARSCVSWDLSLGGWFRGPGRLGRGLPTCLGPPRAPAPQADAAAASWEHSPGDAAAPGQLS